METLGKGKLAVVGAANTKDLSRRQAEKLEMDRRQMLPDALTSTE